MAGAQVTLPRAHQAASLSSVLSVAEPAHVCAVAGCVPGKHCEHDTRHHTYGRTFKLGPARGGLTLLQLLPGSSLQSPRPPSCRGGSKGLWGDLTRVLDAWAWQTCCWMRCPHLASRCILPDPPAARLAAPHCRWRSTHPSAAAVLCEKSSCPSAPGASPQQLQC